ncbi:protein BPS1, chloroplastic-like [Cucurbita moschata]|uniref:Protein BPS1, chloroplastic-like n=1 Tax=Cucurbita moschata TaxID=3662 RepID=A0A6J1H565_CUCMO|nr:protein BPS1, chloroplastic-like [Cucurbita moschata]XP_022959169.1 protein BPS1, chloroplastic-like [Cucurbita moschata]XP_022959170.1 protein BPS1, chloroplastic-like [Cucurbita moschata]
MSRPQEPPRQFFPFGNPFRTISPKGSNFSSKLRAILNDFERNLAERLRKLHPSSKDDVLSLSWMTLAMKLLCETHSDVKNLIKELELPVTDWNEKWIDVYLDISVKLLDVCNVVSSELSHLNQSNLMLRCITHNLDSADSKRLTQARASLDEWRLNISTTNSRIKNCCVILDSLVESLDLPKVKNSAKGKVLMHALYGVKVQTVFVCSVFASTFLGSPKLFDLKIAATYSWGQTFSSLQSDVNSEIRSIYSHGKFTPLKELEAIDQCVGNLHQMIPENPEVQEVQPLKNVISELGGKAEKLSEGVHLLSKEVDNFFQIVLAGRDALLSNLRKG